MNGGYGNYTQKVGYQMYCRLFRWLLPSVSNLFVLSQKLIKGTRDCGLEQPEQDAGLRTGESRQMQLDILHYISPGKLSSMGARRHGLSIQHRGRINESKPS